MPKKQVKEVKKEKVEIIESKKEEVSELEEDLLEDVTIDFSQLQNFISKQNNAPVLDQVEISPNVIGLEHGIRFEPSHRPVADDDSDPFKYHMHKDSSTDTKYVSSDGQISARTSRVNMIDVGRTNENLVEQGAFFTSNWNKNQFSENTERYDVPDRMDVDAAGRGDPFKPKDMNYDPKLPKS